MVASLNTGTTTDSNCVFVMSELSARLFKLDSPSETPVYKNLASLWLILLLAALSFLTTLHLPYNGEEAVYTLTSLEMWFNQEWISPTLYGTSYGRPPLLNWLVIPLASILGWEKVLLASRLVTSLATLSTVSLLMWMVQRLFKNKHFSVLVGILFLSGDLLFRRGWLAYADPLFSLFVFAAIALTWVALEENKSRLLILASFCLIASFLTKALTGYVFYGIALLVFVHRHRNRALLSSPFSILFLLLSLLFPLLWNHFCSQGHHSESMLWDISSKFNIQDIKTYLIKFLLFPLDTGLRWLPISGVILYAWLIGKRQKTPFPNRQSPNFDLFKIALWILVLNYLPYWLLAPQTRIRYILPLYPFFALCFGYLILQSQERITRLSLWILMGSLILKYFFGFWGYDLIEKQLRGNYATIAEDILQQTQGHPLCIEDSTSNGLSVAAEIAVLQLPKPPLQHCQAGGNHDFLLLPSPDLIQNGKIFKVYHIGNNKLYLVCRGGACQPSRGFPLSQE